MLDRQKKLLIVDNEVSILTALSERFSELGYSVKSAKDGSSALSEIEKEFPDILLSDLHMPGIPGIPFLLIMRQTFPSIRVVAMSSAHSGSRVPPGVAADAFYEKGSSLHLLTQGVDAMTGPGRPTIRLSIEKLFGLQFFESIPTHPSAKGLAFAPERSIAFFVSPGSEGLEHSHGQDELPSMR